jgi:predicted nucleic acid-binding protein
VSFVVDSSATLAWVYQDELTPQIRMLATQVSQSGAWVPAIWRLEVANSLQLGVRSRRITAAFRDQAIADLSSLMIMVDGETSDHAWSTSLQLADRFRLTLYDACYLELAQRRGLPLASLDRDLRAAGRKLGLRLLGL